MTDKEWVEERVRSVHSTPLLREEKDKVASIYRQALGKALRKCKCQHIYQDAIVELAIYFKKMAKTSTYIMRRGVVVHFKGETYTYINMTDKVAKELLRSKPEAASLFSSIPTKTEKKELTDASVVAVE